MSVLEKYFDSSVDQFSPCRGDVYRKVNYDEDGNEFITFPEVDYPALTASLGKVQDWSLESLLKAGIDPAFPISTGLNTRLEGFESIKDFEDYYNQLMLEGDVPSEPSESVEE